MRLLLVVATAFSVAAQRAPISAGGLRVEVYGNSVMRGTSRCDLTMPNGFDTQLGKLCPQLLSPPVPHPGSVSLRITGSLTPMRAGWIKFGVNTTSTAWMRLWVDDHRLVDEWGRGTPDGMPATPALLPNVSLSKDRAVTLRADIRTMSESLATGDVKFSLLWCSDAKQGLKEVPDVNLSPTVSEEELQRRALQERVATGWNQWARPSNLAQIVLPQQVGIDLGVRDRSNGIEFRHALLAPQFPSQGKPPVPVRMGHHAYDGSFSRISFVPFPAGTPDARPTTNLNVTVESATGDGADNFVVVSTNATAAAAKAANLSLVVHPQVFWGAAAELSLVHHTSGAATLVLNAGELGEVTVRFSRAPLPTSHQEAPGCIDGISPRRFSCLTFAITDEPFAIAMSFADRGHEVNISAVSDYLRRGEKKVLAELDAATKLVGASLREGYEAMFTSISWNVNFDPRVAVTVPVSRTFEAAFDFIFFDWDMFFLSLMGATAPAADVSNYAFELAISNLIEVTQTRSAYGMVMNKRAALGSSSSDSNDRTEPLVGSMVVHFIYQDSVGTDRESTMIWVVNKLYPTLLRWNQWAWEKRRYNVGVQGGGLLVLGSDNNHPCEGSTVGLNTSKKVCSSRYEAIMESGMDNSPMYYNAFNDQPAGFDVKAGGRLQLYDCQQSALFVSESKALQALAVVAGQADDIATLREQADEMSSAINAVLWDNATGIYRQVDASLEHHGRFSPEISPTSFYPMIGTVASTAQAERMVAEHLTNFSEFCVDPGPAYTKSLQQRCAFSIPTISRASKHFFDNTYWRGRTWGPTNLLTWLALSAPKYRNLPRISAARKGLCRQSYDLLMVEWRLNRHVHENFNSTTGRGGDVPDSNPFYHWGANLAWIAMREHMAS